MGGNSYIGGEVVSIVLLFSLLVGDVKVDFINIVIVNVDFLDWYGGVFRIGLIENFFLVIFNFIF